MLLILQRGLRIYSSSIINVKTLILKLKSISIASLSPSLFENLEQQVLAELSCLRGVVRCHGFSADEF